jgi:hypothetical protein
MHMTSVAGALGCAGVETAAVVTCTRGIPVCAMVPIFEIVDSRCLRRSLLFLCRHFRSERMPELGSVDDVGSPCEVEVR